MLSLYCNPHKTESINTIIARKSPITLVLNDVAIFLIREKTFFIGYTLSDDYGFEIRAVTAYLKYI